jgi:O-antigen ligase
MYGVLIGLALAAYAGLAWKDFRLALTLIVALTPTYILRGAWPIPWTVLEALILIAFSVWFVHVYKHRTSIQDHASKLAVHPWPITKLDIAVYGLVFVATAACFWAPDRLAALGLWKAYFIEPLMVYIMLRTTFTTQTDWTRTLTALAITTISLSVFAIFQKLTGYALPAPWDLERRVTSVFTYPNALGLFVAPIVTAVFVYVVVTVTKQRTKLPLQTIAFSSAIACGLIAIVLAKTEAALVAVPIAIIISAALCLSRSLSKSSQEPRKRKIWMFGLAGILASGLILALAVPGVRQKLLLQDYSGQVRRSQWRETVIMLKDRPLQGAGLAGYPSVFAPYHDSRLYEIFQYPHNLILNFWVEMGIFGVLAWIWIAVLVCWNAWQQRDNPLVLAAFAALLTMTIHGLVDVPFLKNDLAVLTVFFLGMLTHYIEKPLARLAN